jgi:hypothetical protein
MPRASWRGYLRLSLVSCPIYLSPATARTTRRSPGLVISHLPGRPLSRGILVAELALDASGWLP